MGNWLAARPGLRQKLVIATKVAGPLARHAVDSGWQG
jgi:aryl-alcohol dehydrogenase-like predicted oxidoreductase